MVKTLVKRVMMGNTVQTELHVVLIVIADDQYDHVHRVQVMGVAIRARMNEYSRRFNKM